MKAFEDFADFFVELAYDEEFDGIGTSPSEEVAKRLDMEVPELLKGWEQLNRNLGKSRGGATMKSTQVNVAMPQTWRTQLERLARIFSVEEDRDLTYQDLI